MNLEHLHLRRLVIPLRIGIVLVVCCLFVGIALAAGLTDASIDDFSRGSGCNVSQADTGQIAGAVIISPAAGTIFSGTVLDNGWFAQSPSVLSGGNLYVDDGRAGTIAPPFYAAGRALEFVATFQDADYQEVGFSGNDLSVVPWAIFSTGTFDELRVRTNNGSDAESSTALGASYFGTPHLYRIDWRANDVIYWIDGAVVATHTVSFTQSMHPMAEDFDYSSGLSLTLNWMRMSDYSPSPCTYTARIINSGADGTAWTHFTTTVAQPAGTSISFDVRAANYITDIASAPWALVTSNSISQTGRYVQYRTILTTTDSFVTPQLLSASFGGTPLAITLTSISAAPTTPPSTGWLLTGITGAGLLLSLYGYRLIRRRTHPYLTHQYQVCLKMQPTRSPLAR